MCGKLIGVGFQTTSECGLNQILQENEIKFLVLLGERTFKINLEKICNGKKKKIYFFSGRLNKAEDVEFRQRGRTGLVMRNHKVTPD